MDLPNTKSSKKYCAKTRYSFTEYVSSQCFLTKTLTIIIKTSKSRQEVTNAATKFRTTHTYKSYGSGGELTKHLTALEPLHALYAN